MLSEKQSITPLDKEDDLIRFTHRGSFKNTERYLRKLSDLELRSIMTKYAVEGVTALRSNTPKDTGETADKWDYEFTSRRDGFSIYWTNSNINEGIPVVILLQYGHGTRSGAFVEGIDFINPAMRPIFDKIADNLWKEVTSL
jgi:hypothetical protein